MVEKILADASPEKRLFISLMTRDISLIDAILDIIDNSINAALEPLAESLKTADDYQRLLTNNKIQPKVQIELTIRSGQIVVKDTADGISSEMARRHVFKFGRTEEDADKADRLSVYGLGLKRAMFKCGNRIKITSRNREGGFDLDLNVKTWERQKNGPWQFEITPRPPEKTDCGTRVIISELYEDVLRRLGDGLFLNQLREKISRTYSLFIGRVVKISLNGTDVPKETFEIGDNYTSKNFNSGKVSCNITAGIAVTSGEVFRDRNAGWFVFCNGRAILFADKSPVTGWANAGLPIFQPKHRPFLGTVFFVSADPEALPWTTTKASINEESNIWQEAKRHMVTVGRVVIGFLDGRYTGDGTEFAPAELQRASGKGVSVFTAAVARPKTFQPPNASPPQTTKIQFLAKDSDIRKIASYLRKPGMGGSAVGRHTFEHFLKNEVGGDN